MRVVQLRQRHDELGHRQPDGRRAAGVRGEPVLLVDDIQDTGRTLAFTRSFLLERGCHAGLDLHAARQAVAARGRESEVDFVGFTIPDVFVVGYGIDYAERYRQLPYIGRVVMPTA